MTHVRKTVKRPTVSTLQLYFTDNTQLEFFKNNCLPKSVSLERHRDLTRQVTLSVVDVHPGLVNFTPTTLPPYLKF